MPCARRVAVEFACPVAIVDAVNHGVRESLRIRHAVIIRVTVRLCNAISIHVLIIITDPISVSITIGVYVPFSVGVFLRVSFFLELCIVHWVGVGVVIANRDSDCRALPGRHVKADPLTD